MADMVHAVRARQWLDDPGNRVPEDVAATLNASLAIATATREITGAVIAQTRAFETRFHDIAAALESDAGLVRFTGPGDTTKDSATLYVSPGQVAFLYDSGDGRTRVVSGGGSACYVDGSASDVAAKLGVSA